MASQMAMMRLAVVVLFAIGTGQLTNADDTNRVFQPCSDTLIQKKDGFTFGIAFDKSESFYFNKTELSPCDTRLSLFNTARLSVFRPKVDEISLLTINTSTGNFSPENSGGYMVAFAGHKYAARSNPLFVADQTHIITSFTLVLEFKKGRLQNLFWKSDGCNSCKGKSSFVCYKGQGCAIRINNCKSRGGTVDCSLGIQLAFSGTDKHDAVLNSWYEIDNMRQYSLYGLYSNLRNSLTSQYNKYF